jgi:hypothetical protein
MGNMTYLLNQVVPTNFACHLISHSIPNKVGKFNLFKFVHL